MPIEELRRADGNSHPCLLSFPRMRACLDIDHLACRLSNEMFTLDVAIIMKLVSNLAPSSHVKFPTKIMQNNLDRFLDEVHDAKKTQKSTPNMTGRRFDRTMDMIPARPWSSKNPSVSTPVKQSTKQGNARGTNELRRGTCSINFHCPVPRSSNHIGHGKLLQTKRIL